jgi:hypothetical protein
VANDGFPAPYRDVGDEKYRKALVSLRRAEYRFCSFVPGTSDDGPPIVGEVFCTKRSWSGGAARRDRVP